VSRDAVFDTLTGILEPSRRVVVQTHNYPDHDAVAAGFALRELLALKGFSAVLAYAGDLESDSLVEAVHVLSIPLLSWDDAVITADDQIILVDSYIGNRNVTTNTDSVKGVIDHHIPPEPADILFSDIRPTVGSCSTIVWTYYVEADLAVPPAVATALLLGLMMDTDFLTRGVSSLDVDAFGALFGIGDLKGASMMLRNSLSLRHLEVFRKALDHAEYHDDICLLRLDVELPPEVVGILADFFLRLREIRFVVIAVEYGEVIKLSVRSEDENRPASGLLRVALAGIGSGGGHIHMGGGGINRMAYPGWEALKTIILAANRQFLEQHKGDA